MSGKGETELEILGAKNDETALYATQNGPPLDGHGTDIELGKVATL